MWARAMLDIGSSPPIRLGDDRVDGGLLLLLVPREPLGDEHPDRLELADAPRLGRSRSRRSATDRIRWSSGANSAVLSAGSDRRRRWKGPQAPACTAAADRPQASSRIDDHVDRLPASMAPATGAEAARTPPSP